MPTNIARFEPRTAGRVEVKDMPVSTFLRDTFFPGFVTFTTKKIELTFRKGAQLIAPHAAPFVDGIIMDRQSYEVREYEAPTIAPMRPITPEMLDTTLPGENTHTLMSPEDRQQFYIDEDARELSESIDRREEEMISQLLTTGTITVRGYYGNNFEDYREEVLDYGFTQKTALTGTDSWDDAASTPYEDLESWADTVRDAGYDPTTVVMGRTAWLNLRNNEDFNTKLDPRRVDLGMIQPNVLGISQGEGLKFCGRLPGLGLELWVYYGKYKDYTGTVQNFIPDDIVLVLPGMAIGDIAYGAVTWLNPDMARFETFEGTRISRVKINANADTMQNHMYAKPIPRIGDLDSWFAADVINA